MTAPAPLAFPGSRNLAAWWRQLTERQPQALWFGHLLLHRIEALVERGQAIIPEGLQLAVLKALTLYPGDTLQALDRRLHLGPQALRPLLNQLCADGLAQAVDAGWAPTALGQRALLHGDYVRPVRQRCVFYFRAVPAGGEPQYLHLEQPAATPCAAAADWSFDVGVLRRCLGQSADWKQQHRFPLEVERLLSLEADAPSDVPAWQRVVLDRPERLSVLLLLNATGDRLLAFTVKPESWTLQSERPLFDLAAGWPAVFPDLVGPAAEDAWRPAWREWCQPRGLTALADDATRFELAGPVLKVSVSRRLLERLRSTRSDALRDEAWLLAGAGQLRPAALLKIVEAEAG